MLPRRCSFGLLPVAIAGGACRSASRHATPQSVGLSSERLSRITETLKADIAKGDIPGAVLLISRHGKIAYFEAMGSLDPEKKTPMAKDAIFRIYSMTKPITTVAAMMLFEEGKLALNDPVAKYIPAFKDVKVGEEKPGADGKPTLDLVAPKRAMTIQDLMRHSSGLTYGFFGEGARQEGLRRGQARRRRPDDGRVRRTGSPSCRCVYQPGTTWDYSQSTDVLGRVIEVVTGKPLYQALKEHAARPARHDRHELLRDRSRQAGPHRRAVRQRPHDRRRRGRQRSARCHEIRVRRRRPGGHGDGLRPLPADAGQRRHARRQALPEPHDASPTWRPTTWATSSSAGPTT